MLLTKIQQIALLVLCSQIGALAINPVIALTDFEFTGIKNRTSQLFTERVGSDLASNEHLTVIVHSEVASILDELGLQKGPCLSDSCLIESGKIMLVSHIITGKVYKKGKDIAVKSKIINVQTSEVKRLKTLICWGCNEQDLLLKLSSSLTDKVSVEIQGRHLKSDRVTRPKTTEPGWLKKVVTTFK